ncbi:MAG: cytochrome c [Chloroflexi bacterium]|nr:cytochrome c [Chloroflexota bacterium]
MIRRVLASVALATLMTVGLATCGGGATLTYPGNGNAASGRELVLSGTAGCVGCHAVPGSSAKDKSCPNLDHVGSQLTADQIYTQLVDPRQRPAPYATPLRGSADMPQNDLTTQQRTNITAWLSTLK